MGRWSFVFVSILLWTASARAEEQCACEGELAIFPARGARDIPRNAKVWIVGGRPGAAWIEGGDRVWTGRGEVVGNDSFAIERFDAGHLAAHRDYAFHPEVGPATRFTTGAGDDTAAPAAPMVRRFTIAVSEYGPGTEPVAELAFDAVLDPDVVLLRFEFSIQGGTVSRITTVDGWRGLGRPACRTALPFRPGDHVSVAVSAIDLAGNESPPTTRAIEVGHAAPTLPACAQPWRLRCGGMGFSLLFLFLLAAVQTVVLGWIGFAGVLFVRYLRRAWTGRNAVPEPISLLAVERLAGAVHRRGRVVAAIGVLAAIGALGLAVRGVPESWFLAIASMTLVCLGLNEYFAAGAVLRLVDPAQGEAVAEVRGRAVIVRGPSGERRLDVSPRAIAAARLHAIPTSIAKLNRQRAHPASWAGASTASLMRAPGASPPSRRSSR